MSTQRRNTAVVFALAFTTWEGSVARDWSLPGEKKEIVQIDAVKLGAANLKILDTFEMLMRPRFNPTLSDYFAQLSGITNEEISARGVDFVTAYRAFLEFAGDSPLWGFGRHDLVLVENLKFYGWKTNSNLPHYNDLIPWFAAQRIDLKGGHAPNISETAGAKSGDRKHDALDDARAAVDRIVKCVEGGAPNPFLANGF